MNTLINLIIYLLIFGILLSLLYYVLRAISPHLPAPLAQWINIIVMVIGAILLIGLLLSLTGGGGINFPRFGFLPGLPTSA
jgi:hypothetical protein